MIFPLQELCFSDFQKKNLIFNKKWNFKFCSRLFQSILSDPTSCTQKSKSWAALISSNRSYKLELQCYCLSLKDKVFKDLKRILHMTLRIIHSTWDLEFSALITLWLIVISHQNASKFYCPRPLLSTEWWWLFTYSITHYDLQSA